MAKIIKNKPKFNFWLDAALGAGFLLTLATGDELTGLHEWIGIGLGTLIITHIVMHWKWLVSTTKRLFGKMPDGSVGRLDGAWANGVVSVALVMTNLRPAVRRAWRCDEQRSRRR